MPRHFPVWTILFCVLLSLIQPAGEAYAQAEPPAVTPLTAETLEAFFDETLEQAMADYHIAGATLSVVQDNAVLLAKGYGLADVEQGVPVSADATLFRIGSLTKLFTWTAVMQLVEQGKLDLHTDVSQYIDFTLPDTYAEPITLWHLMTHTAGFENRNFGYGAASEADLQPLSTWLPAHIPARVRPPGAAAAYSNYGTALAGYIVERASGLPYASTIERNILQPLGMRTTSVTTDAAADLAAVTSRGYTYANGGFVLTEPTLFQVAPAGSIAATATDMAQFLLAHLGHAPQGEQLLSDAMLAQMHATAYRVDPSLNGMALGFFELNRHGEQIIGHVGAALPSFHSLAVLLPERKLGFFVSFNSAGALPLTTGAIALLLNKFADTFLPETSMPLSAAPDDFDARAAALAGSYRFANYPSSSVTTFEKSAELLGGAVTLAAPGDGLLHLTDAWGEKRFVEISPVHFRQVEGDDALVFALDQQGEMTGFYLSSRSSQLFERLVWYETATFAQILLVLCALAFLSVVAAAVTAWLMGRGKGVASQPRTARLAWRIAGAAAVLNLLFLLGYLGLMLAAPQSIALGQFAVLGAVLVLPVLATMLALAAAPFVWLAWRRSYWGLPARLHYTVSVAALAAFAWVLNQWNLLGWRF